MNTANENTERAQGPRLWCIFGVVALAVGALWILFQSRGPANDPAVPLPEAAAAPDSQESTAAAGDQEVPVPAEPFRGEFGIQVTSVNLAVGGTRLDVRYRVLDGMRAIQLTNKFNRACLLDAGGQPLLQAAGQLAPMQNQSGQLPRSGYIHSYFFPNPNRAVKPNDQVTLVIGNLRQALVVQ